MLPLLVDSMRALIESSTVSVVLSLVRFNMWVVSMRALIESSP